VILIKNRPMFAMNKPISAIPQKLQWTNVNHCIVDSEVEHACPHPTLLSPEEPGHSKSPRRRFTCLVNFIFATAELFWRYNYIILSRIFKISVTCIN